MALQKITPFLWFDHQAEDAAAFCVSIFPNSKRAMKAKFGRKQIDIAGLR